MGDLYIIMMRAANYHIFIHYSIVYCAVFYVVNNCRNDAAPSDMICMDVYVEYRYTVHSGYKGHVYKGQPVIRDRLAGTESFPFILV